MDASHASQGTSVLALVLPLIRVVTLSKSLIKALIGLLLFKVDEQELSTILATWFLWEEIWHIKEHKELLEFTLLYYNTTHRDGFHFYTCAYEDNNKKIPAFLWFYQYKCSKH